MAEEVVRHEAIAERPAMPLTETVNRVSWGAIWAGVMAALGIESLFTLFGLFIGFRMYDGNVPNPWSGVAGWALAWYLVTAVCSMFFGAWCASKLSGDPVRAVAVLHGVATWGLATVATLAIVVLGSWSVLREAIAILGNPSVPAPTASAANVGAMAIELSSVALRVWLGVILGFIAAIVGGVVGTPRNVMRTVLEMVSPTTRRAA